MKIAIVIGIIGLLLIAASVFACFKMSGDCSREEEKGERKSG